MTDIKSYLRSLKPEERQELINTITQEENKEAEELLKNPNLTIERKMDTVLNEIKDLRNHIKTLNACNFIGSGSCKYIGGNIYDHYISPTLEDTISQNEKQNYEDDCLLFDWNILFWIFFVIIFLSIITPGKTKCPIII